MTSVGEKIKYDFLHQEIFFYATGWAYSSNTTGHTSLSCYEVC